MATTLVDLSTYRKNSDSSTNRDFAQTDELSYAIQTLIQRLRDSEPLSQAS